MILIKILGIDEAGRGPVIGPMVICGLMVDENGEKKLREIKVRDSKELTPKKREELAPLIEKIATHVVLLRVQPCKIDNSKKQGINLNKLEALKMIEIINLLEPDKVIVDTPCVNTKKFEDFLRSKIEKKNIEFVCENYADKNYPVVSAASILAKVNRDKAIEELKKKVGFDFGVGYPHDSRTIEFLHKLAKENNGKLPNYVRHSWDTAEQITKQYKQMRVLSFFKKIIKK